MERGKGKVARFSDGQRRFDGFQVPHFAHEHHIGVLPENIFQRILERLRIGIDLTLVHQAFLMRMQVFDRVLDRDDMFLPLVVDLVDHRGKRGRFTAARGAGDEDQSPRFLAQIRIRLPAIRVP